MLRAVALLIAFLASIPAFAVDWKTLKPQGYVSDFAQVIDPANRASIERYCALVEQKTGAQLAFVTIPSTQGEPIEDVAIDLFRTWGIGKKGKDNGALLLLSIQDRKSKLEVGFGLGEAVPDSMAGLLLEDMRPSLRTGQYGAGFLAAAERLGGTIAKSQNVELGELPDQPARAHWQEQPRTRSSIPWGLILFGIFILFLFLRGGRRGGGGGGGGGLLTGLLLGNLLGGVGRGGGGGGGFGGGDSGGGGFGGFGGGDSGGGGASSDW